MSEEQRADGKILLSRKDAVATITFNAPERLNAIEYEMWVEIGSLMPELDADDSVRAVVFRGAGERAFSAGADISRFKQERYSSAQAKHFSETGFLRGLDAVDAFSKPVICLIRGACVGGGVELAAATDLRVAGESSRFGIPVAKLGLVAGYSELRRFVYSIGPARTLDMLLTAKLFTSKEMLDAGFLARVVPDEEVEAAAYEMAERIVFPGAPGSQVAQGFREEGVARSEPLHSHRRREGARGRLFRHRRLQGRRGGVSEQAHA